MANTFTNLPISAVATAPSPATSGTSLVVTAGQGAYFPSVAFYATVCPANTLPLRANAEVVLVTSRSTDTMTISRAAGAGTSARSIVVGDQFFQCVPAETLMSLLWVEWTGTSPSRTGTVKTLDAGTEVIVSTITY